MQYCIVQFSQ